MGKARITRRARRELDGIWAFIASDNIDAAEKVIGEIMAMARKLADMPGLGRQRDELAPGIRSIPVYQYLIFYRAVPNGVEVIHVVHGARDLRQFFRNDV